MERLRGLALVIVTLIAVVVSLVAGYVLDGAGRPSLGFWALTWGTVTFLVLAGGLAIRSGGPAVRRIAWGLLALMFGVLTWGAFVFAVGTPLLSLEGAWLWPLTLGSIAGAVLSVRGLLQRRR